MLHFIQHGWMGRQMKRWLHKVMDEQMYVCMYAQITGWTDGYYCFGGVLSIGHQQDFDQLYYTSFTVERWIGGWMDRWIDGWSNGWTCACIYVCTHARTHARMDGWLLASFIDQHCTDRLHRPSSSAKDGQIDKRMGGRMAIYLSLLGIIFKIIAVHLQFTLPFLSNIHPSTIHQSFKWACGCVTC